MIRFHLDSQVDLDAIASRCSFQFTGADFYALCTDAIFEAISRSITSIDNKVSLYNQTRDKSEYPEPITPQFYMENIAKKQDLNPCVTQSDFLYALERLNPSVSLQELKRYDEIQKRFI